MCNRSAMKLIIKNSYGISRDDLYVETTRLFGFKRCGDNIWYHLYKAFDNMVKNGEVEEIDYKIHLK